MSRFTCHNCRKSSFDSNIYYCPHCGAPSGRTISGTILFPRPEKSKMIASYYKNVRIFRRARRTVTIMQPPRRAVA